MNLVRTSSLLTCQHKFKEKIGEAMQIPSCLGKEFSFPQALELYKMISSHMEAIYWCMWVSLPCHAWNYADFCCWAPYMITNALYLCTTWKKCIACSQLSARRTQYDTNIWCGHKQPNPIPTSMATNKTTFAKTRPVEQTDTVVQHISKLSTKNYACSSRLSQEVIRNNEMSW